MLRDGEIWVANNSKGEPITLSLGAAGRHGFITGQDSPEISKTARVLAEGYSEAGIPVFMTDIMDNLASMMLPGVDSPSMREKLTFFKLKEYGFKYEGFPTTLWDVYGRDGIPLHLTVSELGPLYMSLILHLTAIQRDHLRIVYTIAEDENLLLVDTNDLRAMLNLLLNCPRKYSDKYGPINISVINAILLSLSRQEREVGYALFTEPMLNAYDLIQVGAGGRGMINILEANSLILNDMYYASIVINILSQLLGYLPEHSNPSGHPRMVFFFDEAHFLFKNADVTLMNKIEQIVSESSKKDVSIYFCTPRLSDIPERIRKHLDNRIQLSPHAYSLAGKKEAALAAQHFRPNPSFDTFKELLVLGDGQAMISFFDHKGTPMPVEKGYILPTKSAMDGVTYEQKNQCIKESILYTKYSNYKDPYSAYEYLDRMGLAEATASAKARVKAAEEEKARFQREAELKKERERETRKEELAKKRASKMVGSTVRNTVINNTQKSTYNSNSGKSTKSNTKKKRGLFGGLFK